MNHYAARQRTDGRWDYTCANPRSRTHPVGYCRAYRELKPESGLFDAVQCELENARIRPFAHKYHDDGHGTADEACDCYREYLLDQRLQLHPSSKDAEVLRKCTVCGVYTSGYAELQMSVWWLCDEHRSRDEVEKLELTGMRESFSSY